MQRQCGGRDKRMGSQDWALIWFASGHCLLAMLRYVACDISGSGPASLLPVHPSSALSRPLTSSGAIFLTASQHFFGSLTDPTRLPRPPQQPPKDSMASTVATHLWADTMVTSQATPNSSSTAAAPDMVARSESLPMMMPTRAAGGASAAESVASSSQLL